MRPEFSEHKVLRAADLEDERAYLDDAYSRHLELVHGTDGQVLVATRVSHPDEQAAVSLGSGPAGTALTVSTSVAGGQPVEDVRVTATRAQPAPTQLAFSRPAAAPATGPAPGTLSLLAGVGKPPAMELRIETPAGAGSGRVLEAGSGAKRLSIDATGKVIVGHLTVTGRLALGPAPTPAGPSTPDPTGSVAAAEALRQQLISGLGIGADVGIGIAIANPALGGGRVRFTVEVTDAQGVAPVQVTIRGRVNVGAVVLTPEVGPFQGNLQSGQVLSRDVDVAISPAATGDVIAAVTAYGIHPQRGLVNASEARLLGTVA